MTDAYLAPAKLPVGPHTEYTYQIMNYAGYPPHTWIVVTGPDGVPHAYGFAPKIPGEEAGPGGIWDDAEHPVTIPTNVIPLTPTQYEALASYINHSIDYPAYYDWVQGKQCTAWVWGAVNAMYGLDVDSAAWSTPADLSGVLGNIASTLIHNPWLSTVGEYEWQGIEELSKVWRDIGRYSSRLLDGASEFADGTVTTLGSFIASMVAAFDRSQLVVLWDPIVLDLNGDGVKLTALADSAAYFDMSGSGTATKTGWIDANDGLLVVDRNGDGKINNITELFGSANTDGFVAMKAMDTNNDGVLNGSTGGFC